MFSKALHNRWARLGMGILGVLLMAISINLFVVPHNLYTGGLLGFCQLFRSILTQRLGVDPGFDISGVLYLLLNIHRCLYWRGKPWAGALWCGR